MLSGVQVGVPAERELDCREFVLDIDVIACLFGKERFLGHEQTRTVSRAIGYRAKNLHRITI